VEAEKVKIPGVNTHDHALALSHNHSKSNILEADVALAQLAFDSAQAGHQSGKCDYLTVLDARRTLFGARTQYSEAVVDYQKAKVEVERLNRQSLVELQAQAKKRNNEEE
jgi:outer membrane protein TolC